MAGQERGPDAPPGDVEKRPGSCWCLAMPRAPRGRIPPPLAVRCRCGSPRHLAASGDRGVDEATREGSGVSARAPGPPPLVPPPRETSVPVFSSHLSEEQTQLLLYVLLREQFQGTETRQ